MQISAARCLCFLGEKLHKMNNHCKNTELFNPDANFWNLTWCFKKQEAIIISWAFHFIIVSADMSVCQHDHSVSTEESISFSLNYATKELMRKQKEGEKKSFFSLNIETGPEIIDRISNQHVCSLMHLLYRFASYYHFSRDSYDSKLKSRFKSPNFHYTSWGLSKQRQEKSTIQIHIYPATLQQNTYRLHYIHCSLEMCMPEMVTNPALCLLNYLAGWTRMFGNSVNLSGTHSFT